VEVIPTEAPYQVIHFWHDDGSFANWYVNFEAPRTRSGNRIDTIDWHLDLLISPDRQPTWKDEDEAQAALEAGHLRRQDYDTARTAGQHQRPAALARADRRLARLSSRAEMATPKPRCRLVNLVTARLRQARDGPADPPPIHKARLEPDVVSSPSARSATNRLEPLDVATATQQAAREASAANAGFV
jgi:hypothetical protein